MFAYILHLPTMEHRGEELITAQPGEVQTLTPSGSRSRSCFLLIYLFFSPAKEIQLMHRAPVVGVVVLDGHGTPLPEPLEVAHDLARSPDMHGSHHLLVVSEEQFKVCKHTPSKLVSMKNREHR